MAQAIVGNVYGMYQPVKVLKGWGTPAENATLKRNLEFRKDILATSRAQGAIAHRASVALNNGHLELPPPGRAETTARLQEAIINRTRGESAVLRVNGGGQRRRINTVFKCDVNIDREVPRPRSASMPNPSEPAPPAPKKSWWA
jgi:hypothetical protein